MGDNRDGLGRDRTDDVTADESGTLISADKVIGTAVYDASGERLGTIDSIMLNKRSGKVAYAVMSFGGFLGIGERYHPLPWDVLTYDERKSGYNVQHSADDLRHAPNYSRDEVDTFDGGSDRRREVDSYYGVDLDRRRVSDQGGSPYRGGAVDSDTGETLTGQRRFGSATGVEAADAIGSTTGAGSSGMASTGMGSNRNF
ncbi:MAG: PRC-barrel domain-containing protein [Sphingomonadaceae bacterium]|nr:PRC-barrel domain-containing protein [Sphingomonadaceae bacterium]